MEVDIDDLIADYLQGNLAPPAQERFEQRLATEPELAARVALEREVAAALDASSPENQLRAKLQQLAARYDMPETLTAEPDRAAGKGRRWWALIVGLLILAVAGYWTLLQEDKPAINQPLLPEPELPAAAPTKNSPQAQVTDDKPAPAKKRQLMAAAYHTLPELEPYVGSQLRSGEIRVLVHEPQSNASLELRAGQVLFQLSGKAEGRVPADASFQLMIFSNSQKDFEAMRPVVSQTLAPDPTGAFFVKKQLALSQGLFYIVIEDRQSGEWLFVDKFLVKI